MEVPDHIYYEGLQPRSNSKSYTSRKNYVEDMFVPDKITVGPQNTLQLHYHQPNDVLRDKPNPNLINEQKTPIPPQKLTANELPLEDQKRALSKHKDSHENLVRSLESLNNTSTTVDADPIGQLKNMRRQMGRLTTRVLELEDENSKRVARETGLWFILSGMTALVTYLLFRRK